MLFGDPAERKRMLDLRKQWLDLMPQGSKQIYLYEYYLHTSPRNYPFMPIYFPHEIAEDLCSLKGISMGEFIEVYRPKFGMETLAIDHLNMYLTAQLWWNADQDVDAILGEYYANFYGPAQQEMKTFIEYCEANIAGMSKNPAVLSKILDLIDIASKKVEPDSIYGKRIAFIANYIKPLNTLREQLSVGRKNVPTAVAIDKGKAQITLDGKLDEPFWQNLRNYNFKELQTGKEPNMATSMRIVWAEDSLYFGIRCADEDMQHLNIGTTKNKDPNIWNGDCIELELETQTHSYYQIAISPTGALMDLDRKKALNTLWGSGAQIAAYHGDHFWSLEIRIPVAGEQQEIIDSLNGVSGRKPNETFPWYINVCRQRVRGDETERSAFSPTGSDAFHEVLKFGKLEVR